MSNGIYIYGFINEFESKVFGKSNLTGKDKPIYTISYKDISAVVSDSDKFEYKINNKDTSAHQKILLSLMENYSVIPLTLGVVLENKEDVIKIMMDQYDELKENLEKVENKIELELKVTWNKSYFNIDVQDEEIKVLAREIYEKDDNNVTQDKVHLGHLIENSVNTKREKYMNEIYKPLSNLANDSNLDDNLSIKTVLDAYFLVEKDELVMFNKFIEEIASRYENKLIFDYKGPWPTYNFISINIKKNYLLTN